MLVHGILGVVYRAANDSSRPRGGTNPVARGGTLRHMDMNRELWAYIQEYSREVFGRQDAHLAGLMDDAVEAGLPNIAVTPVPPPPKASRKPAPRVDNSPKVALEFENTDITEVIATIAKAAGMNIVTAPEVQGTITMRLRDVPARKALEAAVETLGYAVTEDGANILRITTIDGAPKPKRR